MAFLDHKVGAEYPYLKKDVYDALLEAIPKIKGMQIDSKDELNGRLIVKAGISLKSWGENIPIKVTEIAPGRTRVEIISSPKTGFLLGGGGFDLEKNSANIDRILNETSKILSRKPPNALQEGDVWEQLKQLKALLDRGLIDRQVYEKKKEKLLN